MAAAPCLRQGLLSGSDSCPSVYKLGQTDRDLAKNMDDGQLALDHVDISHTRGVRHHAWLQTLAIYYMFCIYCRLQHGMMINDNE